MIESGFMDIDFNNFKHFPDLWIWFFVKDSFIDELSRHLRINGYDFQKIFRI